MPLSPPDLANTVTSFCTILAGVVTWLFCRFVASQPARWVLVYVCIFVTGLPTFGWHGFGGEIMRVLDIGSNLLLAWALQLAVLGDFYAPAVRRRVGGLSGVVNLLAVTQMIGEGLRGGARDAVSFGAFGGFYAGELVLIADAFLVTGLLYARRKAVPAAARPLLHVVTGTFLVGLGLATAAGTTVHFGWVSYHALWHVVGAFGFVVFWAFNHVRFNGARA
jgi:hypothetical protein